MNTRQETITKTLTQRRAGLTDRTNNRFSYPLVFLLGALMYLVAVLPFILYHNGLFFYYGDYNVQQVPFYILAHRAVRSGNFFWNPKVDLGSSMGGAFAFYLWGSPFFWLSTLFPEKAVPYLLPFLMSLKYGTAITCAYAWARTYTRTERGALTAAMLYAFSGMMSVNIVFQHMHEAMAFFPLYLLAFDRFITAFQTEPGARKPVSQWLPFTLMTALSAVVNYYFFFGQVIFIVIYYFVRYVFGERQSARTTLRQIISLLLHGLLGLGLAAFFLIQVWDILQGNSRLGDTIMGYDMVAYSEPTTPLAIIKSMFYIPDIVGRGTLFTSEQIKNSSLSAYLPGFSMAGVIGYLLSGRKQQDSRKNWLRRLILVVAIIAFVPVFNAVFSAFNNEYYARWFYMPILFLAMVTARELEDCDLPGLKKGLQVCWVAYCIIFAISFLPSRNDDGVVQGLSIMQYPRLFYWEALVTIVCLTLATLLVVAPAGFEKVDVITFDAPAAPVQDPATKNPAGDPAAQTAGTGIVDVPSVHGSEKGHSPEGRLHILPLTPRRFRPGNTGLLTTQAVCIIMIVCLLSTMGVLFNGNSLIAHSGGVKWKQQMLDGRPELPEADLTAIGLKNTDPADNTADHSSNNDSSRGTSAAEGTASAIESSTASAATAVDPDSSNRSVPNYALADPTGSGATGNGWFRVEADGTSTNYEMVWGYPTVHCFESTVTPSIVDFYKGIGITRTVDSKMNFTHIGARYILSVRYYLDNAIISHDETYDEKGGLPGFEKATESDGYNVYVNQHFIPMGFTFDTYMTEEDYNSIDNSSQQDRLLVQNLILDDETAERYGNLLARTKTEDTHVLTQEELFAAAESRAATSCQSFSYSNSGFQATTSDLPAENLVFFSVPYDKGWTAYVDGEKTDIAKADFGLMAVDVPAGVHQITFTYLPWGFRPACAVSAASLVLLALLIISARRNISDRK